MQWTKQKKGTLQTDFVRGKWVSAIVITFCALVGACRSEYETDVEPGPHGEAGPDLKRVYSKEFSVRKADYFAALEAFYSFVQVQDFTFVNPGDCFSEVLDATGRPLVNPCIALWAATGAPTKAHMTFTVEDKSFNRTDRKDQLRYRIEIFIFEIVMFKDEKFFNDLGKRFEAETEPRLITLSKRVEVSTTP